MFLTCLGGSPLNADTQIIRTVHVWYVPFLVSVGLQYWKLTSTGGGASENWKEEISLFYHLLERNHCMLIDWEYNDNNNNNNSIFMSDRQTFCWLANPCRLRVRVIIPLPPPLPSLDYRPDKWKNSTGKFLRAVVCWQSQIRMLFVWFDWLKSLPKKFWFP